MNREGAPADDATPAAQDSGPVTLGAVAATAHKATRGGSKGNDDAGSHARASRTAK